MVVGFGISERKDVEEFGAFADGCVVGSKIVQELGKGGVKAMGELVKKLSGGPLQELGSDIAHPAKRQRTEADLEQQRLASIHSKSEVDQHIYSNIRSYIHIYRYSYLSMYMCLYRYSYSYYADVSTDVLT